MFYKPVFSNVLSKVESKGRSSQSTTPTVPKYITHNVVGNLPTTVPESTTHNIVGNLPPTVPESITHNIVGNLPPTVPSTG